MMHQQSEIISVSNLSFSYNRHTKALNNIRLSIDKQSFTAIIGPNGSGKSSLIRCLDKINIPQKGEIFIDKLNINSYSKNALAQKVAYVPQQTTVMFNYRVFDIVALGRKPYINWKLSKNDYRKIREALKMMNLEELQDQNINEISGGQQQRVFIARALAQDTSIILLDEPTASLDIKFQIETMNLLKRLSQNGKTIVASLHDINLAGQYCNQIVLMKNGKIFAHGNTSVLTTSNLSAVYDVDIQDENAQQVFFQPAFHFVHSSKTFIATATNGF